MVRLSEILEHNAPHLGITDRKQLLAFYDALKTALREARLTPAGGALPSSLNELLALLPGEPKPAKRDLELTDWSVDNDPKYAAFLEAWRTRASATKAGSKPRAIAAPLFQAVTQLQTLNAQGAKKAELTAAVSTFLEVYALSQHALRLPPLAGPLPERLPEGIKIDPHVTLGRDAKGVYVGLVKRKGDATPT